LLKILILDFDLDFEERSDDPRKRSPLKSEELERILVRIMVEDSCYHIPKSTMKISKKMRNNALLLGNAF